MMNGPTLTPEQDAELDELIELGSLANRPIKRWLRKADRLARLVEATLKQRRND